MMNKISVRLSALLLLVVTACQSDRLMRPYHESQQHMVAAHRGVHTHVPENSVASIREAIEHDIDIVEIDVRISKDGIPVLMHDDDVNRTTTGKGNLKDFELLELKQLKLLHNGQKTEYTVPTLAEALEAGKGEILFDLDIKTSQIEKIIKVVEDTKAHNSVFFFDSDWKILEAVKRAHPDWKIMPRAYTAEEAKEAYRRFKPWAIHVDPSFASAGLADYLHRKGVHVWINALGDIDDQLSEGNLVSFRELLKTNSNIIQTDYPVKVKQLVSTGEFSERLIMNETGSQRDIVEAGVMNNFLYPQMTHALCSKSTASL